MGIQQHNKVSAAGVLLVGGKRSHVLWALRQLSAQCLQLQEQFSPVQTLLAIARAPFHPLTFCPCAPEKFDIPV